MFTKLYTLCLLLEECIHSEVKVIQDNMDKLKSTVQDLEAEKDKCPLNSSVLECEQENISTISEITDSRNRTPSNRSNEKYNVLNHPNLNTEHLSWKTPDAMHCSLNDMFTAQRNTRAGTAGIQNRYRLEYTASPAQERLNENESEMQSSFLDQCQSGQLNL